MMELAVIRGRAQAGGEGDAEGERTDVERGTGARAICADRMKRQKYL